MVEVIAQACNPYPPGCFGCQYLEVGVGLAWQISFYLLVTCFHLGGVVLRSGQTGRLFRLIDKTLNIVMVCNFRIHSASDMEKHPSSLAVLAENSCGFGGNFHKDPVVFEELLRRTEEINDSLKNTSLRA